MSLVERPYRSLHLGLREFAVLRRAVASYMATGLDADEKHLASELGALLFEIERGEVPPPVEPPG